MRSDQPVQPFLGQFEGMHERVVKPTHVARSAKLGAALAYQSQLGFQFGGPDVLRQRLADGDGCERFRSDADLDLHIPMSTRSPGHAAGPKTRSKIASTCLKW